MLRETVEHKELSTSTEIEGESNEQKMIQQAQGKATRQDTKELGTILF